VNTATRRRSPLLLITLVALLAAGGALYARNSGPSSEENSNRRKVTLYAEVGDGNIWAGDFDVTYAIGTDAHNVHVQALARDKYSRNSWQITKTVAVGTVVSVAARSGWPGTPIKVQVRGLGVDTRPGIGVSPQIVTVTRAVK